MTEARSTWPELPIAAWADTAATLQLWTQIVGKVRLALAPPVNHWWHVPLYVTARGLTTGAVPYRSGAFQVSFDFVSHELVIETQRGGAQRLALRPRSVAAFYREFMHALRGLGIQVQIRPRPVEVLEVIPFDEDERHASYDAGYAARFWQALLATQCVMDRFRGDFLGKCSPVHFFWGSFDLAQTRYSGRTAPPHPGGIPNVGDWVTREAYSHECSSCGFWPGAPGVADALFYAYAYPEPSGYRDAPLPEGAAYDATLREFVLPYERLRRAADPDALLLEFFRRSYAAAAALGRWDRAALERA